jgi:hypothetical protein
LGNYPESKLGQFLIQQNSKEASQEFVAKHQHSDVTITSREFRAVAAPKG